jgi:site-specific recombinase XerD
MLSLAQDQPQNQLILLLMADAGLRRDEVVRLTPAAIEGNWLHFTGKGSIERKVPMTRELLELVTQASQGKRRQDRLVGLGEKGVYGRFKKYAALAGAPDLHPHDLRHYFATRILELTGDIRLVQELLGHASISTTEIYTAVRPERLEEAINKMGEKQETETKDTEKSLELSIDEDWHLTGQGSISLESVFRAIADQTRVRFKKIDK